MNETLQRYIFYISCVLLLKNCFSSKLLMALREKINIRWWSQKEYVIKNQLNKTASSDRHFFRPFVASLACFSFLHLPFFSAAQILQHTPMLVPSALLRSSANWEILHLRCKQKIHGVSSCDYYSGPHLASNQRTRFYLYPKVAALWPCGLLVNVHKRVGASCGGLTLSVSVIFLLSCTPIQVAGELTSVFSLSLFPLSQTPITPSFDSDTHTKKNRHVFQLHHVYGGLLCGNHYHDPQLPPPFGGHPRNASLGEYKHKGSVRFLIIGIPAFMEMKRS